MAGLDPGGGGSIPFTQTLESKAAGRLPRSALKAEPEVMLGGDRDLCSSRGIMEVTKQRSTDMVISEKEARRHDRRYKDDCQGCRNKAADEAAQDDAWSAVTASIVADSTSYAELCDSISSISVYSSGCSVVM